MQVGVTQRMLFGLASSSRWDSLGLSDSGPCHSEGVLHIGRIFRVLAKRFRIIMLVMVITVISALLFSLVQTPVYRSAIVLNIWPARLDWSLQNTIKGLMRNYSGIIQSRETAQKVIDRLQLDLIPDELISKIEVELDELTFVIEIRANDYDPLIARDIAQAVAEVFIEGMNVKMVDQNRPNRVEISIRDDALLGELHKPNWKLNALAGVVFGQLGAALVALTLDWLEADIIHTAADVEGCAGISVLGVIPKSPYT